MKNPLNYFRNIEKIKVGGTNLRIEHSSLENLVGFGGLAFVGIITFPIWVTYGLCSLGKVGYEKLKENK